jgi:hypothetical protein
MVIDVTGFIVANCIQMLSYSFVYCISCLSDVFDVASQTSYHVDCIFCAARGIVVGNWLESFVGYLRVYLMLVQFVCAGNAFGFGSAG